MTPRQKRHNRVRARVIGTAERPRLNVFRSLEPHLRPGDRRHCRATPWCAASTLDKEVADAPKMAQAQAVGKLVAERAKAAGISKVVFDRGGYLYHGRSKPWPTAPAKADWISKLRVTVECCSCQNRL